MNREGEQSSTGPKGPSKEQFVFQVFESIAPKYDLMNSVLSFRMHKVWRRFAMKKMHLRPGDKALDLCCGTGDWTISLARVVGPEGHVYGLDFSPKMLEIGQKKVQEADVADRVTLVEGNAMKLPFPDDTFDAVTIGFALRNVPDVKQVLKEMVRVTKPGGQVVSLELSHPTWPVFRQVYWFYFQRILPWVAKVFTGKYEQYRWLPESLKTFPDRQELARWIQEAGCLEVEVYALTGGIAALHIGKKLGL
ncbi:MAG: bifunctional demethylmenaquinone methyltransferase/2-methoxy-6-polyprenyl-1,4-benzoquinol methylase [Bacillaceae bacterium G1]|nr:bifunctional demethylmenaquinone methyltransferase/2-methoxy-6-polyprenyl-1,4-benzoquinol methylase [Bacillota bacterium]OJF18122.1 MAG: bifunctional demethylmenaquinone methyltransferase/2-methoxy-6-polyprenyl-1,4-benzoquinol methylase [Bacillaceae bacterium G1]